MSAEIACPGCNNKLTLPDDFAGQRVQCSKCRLEFAALATAIPAMEVDPQAQTPTVKPTIESAEPANQATSPPLQTAYAPASNAVGRSPAASESPLIYCILCGTRFPQTEDVCPGCGHSLRELLDEKPRERRRPPWRNLQPPHGYLPILGASLLPLGAVLILAGSILVDVLRNAPPGARFWIPVLLFGVGFATVVTALAFCLAWLFQAWRVVLVGDEDYSPGLMVGLLFVPFFNAYWMFRAIPGLSTALHDELKLHAPTRPHSTGWVPGLAACMLALIPFPPVWAVAFCMFVAWMLIANNAVHRLVRFHDQMRADAEKAAAESRDL